MPLCVAGDHHTTQSVWKKKHADGSCEGLNYTTSSEQYDQVCGRIIGYQIGSTDAFLAGSGRSIDISYVDGISVTHGSPRQHIWTFAAGIDEGTSFPAATCPCVSGSTASTRIPSFVGQNYSFVKQE